MYIYIYIGRDNLDLGFKGVWKDEAVERILGKWLNLEYGHELSFLAKNFIKINMVVFFQNALQYKNPRSIGTQSR